MIAFNKTALHNTFLVDEALNMRALGFITNHDVLAIKQENPSLRTNKNIVLRIGFFLLGAVLFASCMGLLAWIVFSSNNSSEVCLIAFFSISAILAIIGCEFISKQYFRYGIDDAFIIGAIGCIYGFLVNVSTVLVRSSQNSSLSFNSYEINIAFIMAIVSLIACLRYCNWITALFSIVCFTSAFYLLVSCFTLGIQLIPFVMMILSVGYYFLFLKLSKINKTYHYVNSLSLLKVFSLVLFYSAGNYLLIRKLSETILGSQIEDGQDIPYSVFFWIFTFIIPVFYFYWSIFKKDKIFLNIGFLTFCFSIFTFRTFFHVLPIEIALTLSGIILFTITYFIIRSIKDNISGITFKPDRSAQDANLVNLEAVIINSQVSMQQNAADSPMEFGGGGYSGGGAGESF